MKKFEYKFIEIEQKAFWDSKLKTLRIEDKFNELGKDRWELVTAAEFNSGGMLKSIVYTFKREKI